VKKKRIAKLPDRDVPMILIDELKVLAKTKRGTKVLLYEANKPGVAKQKLIAKRNPSRERLTLIYNNVGQSMNFVSYRNADCVFCFVEGGVHELRFVLRVVDVKKLVGALLKWLKSRGYG